MFRVPRNNLIECDEGFSVEVLGRTGLRYREGDRSLFIDSEVLTGEPAMVLYSGSIRHWEPPHQAGTIDDATRAAIIDRVRRAIRFQGHEIDVF
ncbi:Imm74 family immunity protein [Desertibaculum subflavum]|uniref:Imm74 family immunity protein n=1 Tax=Desertibaculum subflavum TaxID=2268458 RepID=UPI000E66D7E8